MKWRTAIKQSPDREAIRTIQEGQHIAVSIDGSMVWQERANYAIWKALPGSPDQWADWKPMGITARELKKRIKDPTKVPVKAGWLSPDGIFYECQFKGHTQLARALVVFATDYKYPEEEPLYMDWELRLREVDGWAKLYQDHPESWWFYEKPATPAQMAVIEGWYQLDPLRKRLPYELRKDT